MFAANGGLSGTMYPNRSFCGIHLACHAHAFTDTPRHYCSTMTPTRALLTVAVVVTLTAGAVVVVSASRVGKDNYNVGSDPPPPPQVSDVVQPASQNNKFDAHGLTRSWQNTSTVPQIVSTAYDFLESHQLTGTKWGLPFHFYRPSLQKCTPCCSISQPPTAS